MSTTARMSASGAADAAAPASLSAMSLSRSALLSGTNAFASRAPSVATVDRCSFDTTAAKAARRTLMTMEAAPSKAERPNAANAA